MRHATIIICFLLTRFMFLLWPTLLLVFYGLPYYFSTVLRATSAKVYHDASVYCNASVYTVSLRIRGASTLAFKFFILKLFTDTRSKVGHETCSSFWSCDRNLNQRCTNVLLLLFGCDYLLQLFVLYFAFLASEWIPQSSIVPSIHYNSTNFAKFTFSWNNKQRSVKKWVIFS